MFEIICSILFTLFILVIASPLFFDDVNEFFRELKRNTFFLGIFLLFDSLFELDYSSLDILRFILWLAIGSGGGLLFYNVIF